MGSQREDVKKVISISILGGSRDKSYIWGQPFKKHYQLLEKYSCEELMEGIELIQYSIFQFEATDNPLALCEWVTF